MKSNFSVCEALQWGIEKLKIAGVETPVLDAEVLLAHSAILRNRRIDRAWLYAHDREHLSTVTLEHFRRLVKRRVKREPVAYIVGYKEFCGLDFLVNRKVLIPRPETEMMVEQALEEIKNEKCKIKNEIAVVDVGTGSGAIAVAVAKSSQSAVHSSQVLFFATDISAGILRVAKQNARRQGVADRIQFLKGDLLEPVLLRTPSNSPSERGRNDAISSPARDFSPLPEGGLRGVGGRGGSKELLIIANLPYLPTAEWRGAMPEVRKWEPRGALDGGKDGLRYYWELFGQIYKWCHNPSQPPGSALARPVFDPLILRGGDRSEPPLKVRGGEGELCITILCEICPEQAEAFKKFAREFFPSAKFEVIKDLAGRNRVVKVTF